MPKLISIPLLADEASLVATYQLDGLSYRFTYDWVERTAGWYLSVDALGPEERLLSQRRIVLGWPLTSLYRNARLFSGALVAISLDPDRDDDPGFNELGAGRRVQLIHYTDAELELDPAAAPTVFVEAA